MTKYGGMGSHMAPMCGAKYSLQGCGHKILKFQNNTSITIN